MSDAMHTGSQHVLADRLCWACTQCVAQYVHTETEKQAVQGVMLPPAMLMPFVRKLVQSKSHYLTAQLMPMLLASTYQSKCMLYHLLLQKQTASPSWLQAHQGLCHCSPHLHHPFACPGTLPAQQLLCQLPYQLLCQPHLQQLRVQVMGLLEMPLARQTSSWKAVLHHKGKP